MGRHISIAGTASAHIRGHISAFRGIDDFSTQGTVPSRRSFARVLAGTARTTSADKLFNVPFVSRAFPPRQ
jgi:hypothetical protein